MGVIGTLVEKWESFKTELKTEERTEQQVNRQQIKDINEELDHDRGLARGRQKQEERRRKSLEKSLESDKQANVSQYMNQQKEELRKKNYENATSLRKLFQVAERQDVDLYSRDMQKSFGSFQDIWLLQSGQIGLVTEERDTPVAVGRTTADLLRNPGGLNEEVQKQMMVLNLNNKGQPVETPENQKVPDVFIGPDGEMTFTENYQEQYLEKVGKLKSQISRLASQKSATEKAFVKLNSKVEQLERDLELSEEMKDSNAEQLDRRLDEMKNITSEYDKMQRTQARLANHKTMSEEMVGQVVGRRDQFMKELTDKMEKSELDMKEQEIRRAANLAAEIASDMGGDSGQKSQGKELGQQMQNIENLEEGSVDLEE